MPKIKSTIMEIQQPKKFFYFIYNGSTKSIVGSIKAAYKFSENDYTPNLIQETKFIHIYSHLQFSNLF